MDRGTSNSIVNINITCNTIDMEATLSVGEREIKVEDIYSSEQWKEEDEYEIIMLRKVIYNHVFKQVKLINAGGVKISDKGNNKNNTQKWCMVSATKGLT